MSDILAMDAPRFIMRAARDSDFDALVALAKETGPGFTNIPNDPDALRARLNWSVESFNKTLTAPEDELYILLLEDRSTGAICGTAMVFSKVGVKWPFYSYKITQLSQYNQKLNRIIRNEVLNLVNDLEGTSEVGGLFLSAALRSGGIGRMVARSRYLFMASHRSRFADRTISELRGWIDEDGTCPFWDGLAGKFFQMPFSDADLHNSMHGNQFIADLMPKYPIYSCLLPDETRGVIGRHHDHGGGAMRLLKAEGFRYDGYVDIFDGGPTMMVETDTIATLAQSLKFPIAFSNDPDLLWGEALLATGQGADFQCWHGMAAIDEGKTFVPNACAQELNLNEGQEVRHVAF